MNLPIKWRQKAEIFLIQFGPYGRFSIFLQTIIELIIELLIEFYIITVINVHGKVFGVNGNKQRKWLVFPRVLGVGLYVIIEANENSPERLVDRTHSKMDSVQGTHSNFFSLYHLREINDFNNL